MEWKSFILFKKSLFVKWHAQIIEWKWKMNASKIDIDIMLVPLFCILQTAVGAC